MILQINKNIGHVLFIVEGAKHEFTILNTVFQKILGYELIVKKRNDTEYYQSKVNNNNVVAVINTETSNIKSINDENSYLDNIYETLLQKYNFNVNNAAIYYIFDRDVLSNTDSNFIKNLINLLRNSRENENYNQGGVLLLSYPSIEAYDISNFIDDTFSLEYKLGFELKKYINDNAKSISLNKFNEMTIIKATNEMLKYFDINGIELDLDNIGDSNLLIYEKQEAKYMNNGTYNLLSLVSLALLDLGIITL